jgi:hypothetical protein
LRDVYLVEAQLTALEAKRKASQQRIEQPGDIPAAVLLHFHPEFQQLNAQLEALRMQKEEMKQYFRNADDPRLQQLDQQIATINKRLENTGNSTDGGTKEEIIFEDSFQKQLKDGWTWLREVPDHWRITDDALEIKMEALSGDNVRNILFRKPPKKDAGSFDVAVEVKALRPYTNQFQQAGLYWMQGDKYRLKFVLELIDGEIYVFPGKKPVQTEHVVLRLGIDGTKVVGEYQPDAKGEFIPAFESQVPERNDDTDRIALQCWHGPADAETWIRFQNFSIKKPGANR